jgi:plasmid stability protein
METTVKPIAVIRVSRMYQKHYACIMDATLQVRGLDAEVVAELKARAARKRMSLSAYVADILTEVAATPAPDTIRERLEALRSLGGGASRDDVVTEIRKIRES